MISTIRVVITLGENIAEHVDLQISFQAFKRVIVKPLAVKEGFTLEQRFFLAYACVWAGNVRPEEILKRTKSNPHSLGKWCVNGLLPHIQNWYDAFGIISSGKMYLQVEKRVFIW